jgi:hypothetical protein
MASENETLILPDNYLTTRTDKNPFIKIKSESEDGQICREREREIAGGRQEGRFKTVI